MKKTLIAGLAIVLIFVVAGVIAEDKIPLEVRIKSITGDVDVRMPGTTAWQDATRGMVLKEGAAISTGYGSGAELQMADNSIVIVYQLTQIKIDNFFREKATVKTKINLRIGKIKAQVQKVGERLSDFDVVTPTSVVSARGTITRIGETDFGTRASSEESAVTVRGQRGAEERVEAGQETSVAPGEVATSVVVERLRRSKANTTVLGQTRAEVRAKDAAGAPEVKPGEPGKIGSIS